MPRSDFDHQLEELRGAVVTMSSMVDKAIARSMEALQRQDLDLAHEVIAADADINRKRWEIEELAFTLIATQAPMARDLRNISSAIHIGTDLERMADHAAGIGKIVLDIAHEAPLKPLVDLPRMAEVSRSMLADAISAYIA
ncbi:MAG: phosphate signaling complex PhoU family protein, partial [Chloroflexota bacterium]